MPIWRTCAAAILALACAVVALQAVRGCREVVETEEPWFTGEYVDPAHITGTLWLDVVADGTFTLSVAEREGADDVRGSVIAGGSWKSLGDGVELIGEGWSATLVTDEVEVTLDGRGDTLSGLRCAGISGRAPVDSARFVRYREFADLVNPPSGSGRSGSGL